MNIIRAIFVLTFGVLMPDQYRCDSAQVNNDIGGFQFELLLAYLADFQSVIEDRYETSLSQIASSFDRLESRMDAMVSYVGKRFEDTTLQIMTKINESETKVAEYKSHAENRFERVAHQIDAFKAQSNERFKTNNHFRARWVGKFDELKVHIENRIEHSASQIITKMNQNVAKLDGFESRLAKQIEKNSSQIIDTIDRQIKLSDSNVARRIETSSSQFVDKMRHLHTKVDMFESRMEERYENCSLIADRLEEKVDKRMTSQPYQSSMDRLDNHVEDLSMGTLDNLWIPIQQRFNGSVDFCQNWNAYKNGFGRQPGEFWIGLQPLYQKTRYEKRKLLIVLEDFDGNIVHALYDDFKIGSEDENYVLKSLGEYSGTAKNSFRQHLNAPFSTYDRDNARNPYLNCAFDLQGGWWFKSRGDCTSCNLNGKYYQQPKVQEMQGWNWHQWHGDYYSLKSTKMMISLDLP